ncbi:MAG: hypothetical protein QGI10_05285 [Vicinamibacterales bacterium]|nr:hypothetical protein [Vicinamibacterales bacterium]HJN44824.1 hypothetical protein [Vicinamibacterales bacterium]
MTGTTEAVKDVEKKLGPLAEMHELSKSTETRLATLNSLAEHVLQKVRRSRIRNIRSSTPSSSRIV